MSDNNGLATIAEKNGLSPQVAASLVETFIPLAEQAAAAAERKKAADALRAEVAAREAIEAKARADKAEADRIAADADPVRQVARGPAGSRSGGEQDRGFRPVDREADGGTVAMKPEESIGELALSLAEMVHYIEAATPEEAGRLYDARRSLARLVADFCRGIDGALIERLMAGLPVHVQTAEGVYPLRAVPEKTTKCVDAKETARTLLETQGPDALAQMLTTQPFKPAACRAVLGDAWKDHFTVEEKLKLTQSGKPVPKRVLSLGREGIEGSDDGDE